VSEEAIGASRMMRVVQRRPIVDSVQKRRTCRTPNTPTHGN
jgi:hypothetical protein